MCGEHFHVYASTFYVLCCLVCISVMLVTFGFIWLVGYVRPPFSIFVKWCTLLYYFFIFYIYSVTAPTSLTEIKMVYFLEKFYYFCSAKVWLFSQHGTTVWLRTAGWFLVWTTQSFPLAGTVALSDWLVRLQRESPGSALIWFHLNHLTTFYCIGA